MLGRPVRAGLQSLPVLVAALARIDRGKQLRRPAVLAAGRGGVSVLREDLS